ncbi:MAG: PH domain-containing protein [archaeon]|nr:PH domain-containing protein [archaeon]MCP8306402.1 PH domain-containing protein [archaeon]
MKETQIKIGEEFKPAPQFKRLYFIYLILAIPIGILTWYVPVLIFAPFMISLVILIPILAILIFIAYWIPRYYDTMLYRLDKNEMTWRRGVWFKKTGIVPYNRITNVDIAQGPISRMLGIASLKVQTAGYSAPSSGFGGFAEIRIEGMEEFEELREKIMEFVRGKRPVAVETYEEDINLKILEELVKIRELLERSSRNDRI